MAGVPRALHPAPGWGVGALLVPGLMSPRPRRRGQDGLTSNGAAGAVALEVADTGHPLALSPGKESSRGWLSPLPPHVLGSDRPG